MKLIAQMYKQTNWYKDLSFIQVTDEDRWLPPETLLLVQHDARSDIWSLGATMIELFNLGIKYHIDKNETSWYKYFILFC